MRNIHIIHYTLKGIVGKNACLSHNALISKPFSEKVMKLFISYSRDDKAWVYELWRALRDRAHHDAWIDQRLLPAQDWWASILENVENCECCIYVMSPMSVQSIYCLAEVRYALALGKPVLPLMLKNAEVPAELLMRRIQYLSLNDKMSLADVLFEVERGLGELRVGLLQNRFPAQTATRPPEPQSKQEQAKEVYLLAEDAYEQNNHSLAEKLWKQVIASDPQRWGKAAQERLDNLIRERECGSDYQTIATMLEKGQIKAAQAAWRVYLQTCGADYDPRGIADYLAEIETAANQQVVIEPIVEEILEPQRYEAELTEPESVQEEKPKTSQAKVKNQPEKAKNPLHIRKWFTKLNLQIGAVVLLVLLLMGTGYFFGLPTYNNFTNTLAADARFATYTQNANQDSTRRASDGRLDYEELMSTAQALCNSNNCPQATDIAATAFAQFNLTSTARVILPPPSTYTPSPTANDFQKAATALIVTITYAAMQTENGGFGLTATSIVATITAEAQTRQTP
jgi:hypothetical protein